MEKSRTEIIKHLRVILEPWITNVEIINEIGEETDLMADFGLDSIGVLHVILEVEKEFGISIKEHELDSKVFSKMGNFIGIIEKKVYENN